MDTGAMTARGDGRRLTGITAGSLLVVAALAPSIGFLPAVWIFTSVLVGAALLLFAVGHPGVCIGVTVLSALLGSLVSLGAKSSAIPLTLFQITLMGTLFIYLQAKLISGNLTIQGSPVYAWIIAFLSVIFISCVYSRARGDALLTGISILPLAFMVVIVADTFRGPRSFRWLYEGSVLVLAVPGLMSVYTFIVHPSMSLSNAVSGASGAFWVTGRQVGASGDPNAYAMMLVFPILYLIVRLFLRRDRAPKVLWLYHAAMLLVLFGALLTTYSRSAWLSLAVATLFVFALERRLLRLMSLMAAVLGVIVVFAVNTAFVQSLITRAVSVLDLSSSGSAASISNNSRIILARAGLAMFYDSHFLGFGYRSFQALAGYYFDLTKTGGVYSPHNISIQILAELGIPGLVAFYGIILSLFRLGFRVLKQAAPESRWVVLTLMGYLLGVLIFHQLYPQGVKDNLLWYSFGGLLAARSLAKAQ